MRTECRKDQNRKNNNKGSWERQKYFSDFLYLYETSAVFLRIRKMSVVEYPPKI